MISTTHPTLNEALKVICKEQPRQFAVAEQKDETLDTTNQTVRITPNENQIGGIIDE